MGAMFIYNMSSIINSKRQGFRNEIRQRQLSNYFAMKRKLLYEEMDIEHHYFRTTFQNILEERDVEENLSILNGLAFDRQLSDEFSTPVEAQQLYFDIVHFLIRVATAHEGSSKEDKRHRIKCINTILNLLSDYHCPNSALAETICEFLNSFYSSVSVWGFDEDMVEVGCLIANLINKESFGQETDEAIITYLFDWIEELLHIKEQNEMAESLYFGLLRLVASLQARYKVTALDLPQLYKTKILNLIDITLNNESLLEATAAGLSLRVANFLHHLLPVILTSCAYDSTERLVSNIFKQLGTLRKKLVRSLTNTLVRLFTFQDMPFEDEAQFKRAAQVRNQIRWFIMKTYHHKLVIFLKLMETEMKEQLFEIVYNLIACDLTDSVYFLDQFVEMHLEDWMMKTFEVNNSDLNILFMQMVNVATDLKMRECFDRFIALTEKHQLKP